MTSQRLLSRHTRLLTFQNFVAPSRPLQSGNSSPLAAQGRALPDLDSDLSDKLTNFLNGLRLLLPQAR